MKKITTLILSLLFIGFSASAQTDEIYVKAIQEAMSLGSKPGIEINVFERTEKEVEKAWKKLMKKYKAKTSSKKGEMKSEQAEIEGVSNLPMNVYAIISEKKNREVTVKIFIDLGGAFLTSSQHKDAFETASRIFREFAVDQSKEGVEEIVKAEEKEMKKLNESKEDLVKDKEKLEDNIKDWERDIAKAKEKIEENKKDQEKMKKALEEQKAKLDKAKKRLESVE